MPRGALIVIEGLDRAGKTTQCALLESRLYNSRLIKFPDRTTPIGQVINTYLTTDSDSDSSPLLEDHAIHLLFSANRWEALPSLLASLEAGETLILDRYIYSGIAFSIAKGTLGYEYARAPDVGLPSPDAVVFLDLPVDVAKGRAGFGGERYERSDVQERVRGCFDEVRRREGAGERHGWWTVVDAGQGIEKVAEMVEDLAVRAMIWAKKNELRRIE
ncbi:thymidylate kinase-domain-containing protein [Tricharina praecox]|uniref:thymidylate kinase-domain-containing protein n=1 Tax=Tricharina praecox TaxID=43433 RepID=UPI00221ED55E|nr:thymidylate kinase-domain-containing protein [Tricharina praecox]KAI5854381.1 thymidylate kinase-domain-containing protein [Tricharina praecox]